MANGKCETLRDRETSIFLCEPETFWLFTLRDRDFKVFRLWARDVKTLKIGAPDFVESYENELEWARTNEPLVVNPCTRHQIWKSVNSQQTLLFSWPWPNFRSGVCAWSFPFDFLTDALSLTTLVVWKWAKRMRGRVWTQLRRKRSCIKNMGEIEMGKMSSFSHRRRKHESRKYSMNVSIYQCADNSLLVYINETSILARTRKQPRNTWSVRSRSSSFIQHWVYYDELV